MSLDPNGTEDEKGIENSKIIVSKIIEEEIALGIDPGPCQHSDDHFINSRYFRHSGIGILLFENSVLHLF